MRQGFIEPSSLKRGMYRMVKVTAFVRVAVVRVGEAL